MRIQSRGFTGRHTSRSRRNAGAMSEAGLGLLMAAASLLSVLSVLSVPARAEQAMPLEAPAAADQRLSITAETAPEQTASGASPLTGAQLFTACAACHALAPEAPHKVGPNLYYAIGAAAATQPGFQYSPALQSAGLSWNRATLITWLAAGEKLVPGTWMLFDNTTLLPQEIPVLVEYLFEQSAAAKD